MKLFEDSEIIFLDDQKKYLAKTEELFRKEGKAIKATLDLKEFYQVVEERRADIIMSDLDLDHIRKKLTGDSILTKIRESNPSVFLCLYTAYEDQLTPEKEQELEQKNIKVYSKAQPTQLLEDLKEDFFEFQKEVKQKQQRLF